MPTCSAVPWLGWVKPPKLFCGVSGSLSSGLSVIDVFFDVCIDSVPATDRRADFSGLGPRQRRRFCAQ
jgi:hypothetical protein